MKKKISLYLYIWEIICKANSIPLLGTFDLVFNSLYSLEYVIIWNVFFCITDLQNGSQYMNVWRAERQSEKFLYRLSTAVTTHKLARINSFLKFFSFIFKKLVLGTFLIRAFCQKTFQTVRQLFYEKDQLGKQICPGWSFSFQGSMC